MGAEIQLGRRRPADAAGVRGALGLTFGAALPWAAFAAAVFLSRLVITAGLLAGLPGAGPGGALHAAAVRYDADWYRLILVGGYPHSGPAAAAAAFYPGYPLLARPLALLGGGVRSQVAVDFALVFTSNLAFLLAGLCLARLYGPRLGPWTTAAGLGLLACAPAGVFTAFGFSESAFLLFVAAAFLAADRERWVLAGVAGAAACLVRANGVMLAVPLLWAAIAARGRLRPLPAAAGALLFCVGGVAYPAYLWLEFGDPMRYLHLQQGGWHHRLVNPLNTIGTGIHRMVDAVRAFLRGASPAVRRVDAGAVLDDGLFTVLAPAAALIAWLRLNAREAVWVLLVWLPPLASFPVPDSEARYLVAAFPLFFALAAALGRLPALAVPLMLGGLLLQWELAYRVAQGWFIG